MAGKRLDLSGQKIGFLTFVTSIGRGKWLAKCDCGNRWAGDHYSVRSGRVKSCGCYNKTSHQTHGNSRHPLYGIWAGMMKRCYSRTCRAYRNYGGRGIVVISRWHDFKNFVADVYPRPVDSSLDRVDNNGPYSLENCRWASREQQSNNTRANRVLRFNGESKTVSEWARAIGVKRSTLNARLNDYHWTVEKALTRKGRGVSFG